MCSRHFKNTDFKWTPLRKTLKPGSVPSIFNWTDETTPRRDIFKHPLPEKRARRELTYDVENEDNMEVDTDALDRTTNEDG